MKELSLDEMNAVSGGILAFDTINLPVSEGEKFFMAASIGTIVVMFVLSYFFAVEVEQ